MLHPELRKVVWAMNLQLPKNGLVTWTGGNVSGIDRDAGHVVIKPSGVLFEDLTPESLVVVTLTGEVVEGDLKPSVDTDIHTYIYRHRADVGGIAHTHSPYATSFALSGKPIPAALTPMVHALGSAVPCSEYATPGNVDTARAVIETIGDGHAVLVRRHGPFTLGSSPVEAVKYAAMLEEAAKTIHLASLFGEVDEIPPDEVARSFAFYSSEYGQNREGAET